MSQVVAVSPGCPHDFTVVAGVRMTDEKGPPPDAVAEIFWLDASGGLLRGDALSLALTARPVAATKTAAAKRDHAWRWTNTAAFPWAT